MSFGLFLGPLIGGILDNERGFKNTCAFFTLVMVFYALSYLLIVFLFGICENPYAVRVIRRRKRKGKFVMDSSSTDSSAEEEERLW